MSSEKKEWWLDHDCFYTGAEIKAANQSEYPISKENLIHVISADYHDAEVKRLEGEVERLKADKEYYVRQYADETSGVCDNPIVKQVRREIAYRDSWRTIAEEMAGAGKIVTDWFVKIKKDQEEKLMQGFDRACENWDKLTIEPLDLEPLITTLEKFEKMLEGM